MKIDPIALVNTVKIQAEKRDEELSEILKHSPPTIKCEIHEQERRLNRHLSGLHKRAMYSKCDMCVASENECKSIERLRRAGVPSNLLYATLDNWLPNSNADKSNLEMVKAFAPTRCGFLVMLGDLGTGKSHLAVGVGRQFKSPMYITQGDLLRRLRSYYRDKTAIDPVDQAQQADLLILDDMGLSAGGRDEMPMLHNILTRRYNERKPTILTGNISLDQLKSLMGERMADRLKESAYRILIFGGASHRREVRERYFQNDEI